MIQILKASWRGFFPPTMAEVLVARHGETLRNQGIGKRVHFDTLKELGEFGAAPDYNTPLVKEGEIQAQKLGEALLRCNLIPEVIIHSGYLRTFETARIARAGMKKPMIPLIEDHRLRERETGYTFHMINDEARKHFEWKQDYWDRTSRYLAVPPGGESYAQMCEGRVGQALEELRNLFRGKRVLFVLHGGTNKCVHMELMRMNFQDRTNFCARPDSNPTNCSLSRYFYDPDYNEMKSEHYATPLEKIC